MRTLLIAVAAATLASTGAEAAEFVIKAGHANASGEVHDEGVKYFKQRLAAITGRIVAALASRQAPSIDMAPLRPNRFGTPRGSP